MILSYAYIARYILSCGETYVTRIGESTVSAPAMTSESIESRIRRAFAALDAEVRVPAVAVLRSRLRAALVGDAAGIARTLTQPDTVSVERLISLLDNPGADRIGQQ